PWRRFVRATSGRRRTCCADCCLEAEATRAGKTRKQKPLPMTKRRDPIQSVPCARRTAYRLKRRAASCSPREMTIVSCVLAMSESRRSFFDESAKAFAKILFGEARVEQAALECKPCLELDLRLIDRGLDPAGNGVRVRRHLPGDGHCSGFKRFVGNHARYQAG